MAASTRMGATLLVRSDQKVWPPTVKPIIPLALRQPNWVMGATTCLRFASS